MSGMDLTFSEIESRWGRVLDSMCEIELRHLARSVCPLLVECIRPTEFGQSGDVRRILLVALHKQRARSDRESVGDGGQTRSSDITARDSEQRYLWLEQKHGETLDSMSYEAQQELASSVSVYLLRRVRQLNGVEAKSVRKLLLWKLETDSLTQVKQTANQSSGAPRPGLFSSI